jgi:hypothetical protein
MDDQTQKGPGGPQMTDTSKLFWSEDFSGATVGEDMYSCPPIRTCKQSQIVEHDGVKYGATGIKEGQSGWGDWGFTIEDPEFGRTRVGDEIWWSQQMYWPEDFDFWTDHGSLKLFRIGKVDMGGDNRGCVDVQIRSGDQDWRAIVEYASDSVSWENFTGGRVKKGVLQRFECYTYLHPTDGIIRMYLDGVLFGESSRRCTMNSDEKLLRILWSTYWNGNAPQDQYMLLGEGHIAIKNGNRDDSLHLDDDGHGNKFIGNNFGSAPPVVPPVDPVNPPVDPVDPPVIPEPPALPEAPDLDPGERVATMQVRENRVYVYTKLPVTVVPSE